MRQDSKLDMTLQWAAKESQMQLGAARAKQQGMGLCVHEASLSCLKENSVSHMNRQSPESLREPE